MQFIQIVRNGKRWLLSTEDFKLSLCLFHPNNWKGKLFRSAIIVLHKLHCVTILPAVSVVNYELDKHIYKHLTIVYRCSRFDYSIYSNDDGITPKQTIQVVNSGVILGYCHLSDSDKLLPKFEYEQEFLNYIKDKSIEDIPIPLYLGVCDNKAIFCQSTIMTKNSRYSNSWNEIHTEFLKLLLSKTEIVLPFEQTDFYHLLLKFENISSQINDNNNICVLKEGIDNIFKVYQNKIVHFCACHWDFTPWNMFVEKENLFVFDWEYAQKSFPPFIDYFHFFTQDCILNKGMADPKEIINDYLEKKHREFTNFSNQDITFLCYLVAIVLFYFSEHKGFSEKDKSYQCWIGLINILNQRI